MTEQLAILGGPKAIQKSFKHYNPIGPDEVRAAKEVVETGVLSQFRGSWGEYFYGGPKVKEFERNWSNFFGVKHSVSVNSATSALIVALGALDLEPGDEVIVSPWTMCASATAILVWNAIPVFADIERETFNMDPRSFETRITSRTKAVVVPDIFGHPAQLDSILKIAKKNGLKVIEDCAQAPGSLYHGRKTGTIADIGVYSLNYHKHIHTGEGGVAVTQDDRLAERMQLIRNHAEAVVGPKRVEDISNMIGFNFRMGEIEAAIAIEQLKKLPDFIKRRGELGAHLTKGIRGLDGLKVPEVQEGCSHIYYIYGLTLDPSKITVPRERIIEALTAEGVPTLSGGYANVHLLPMYQKRIAYGKKGFPWHPSVYSGDVSYQKGICPVAEELHDRSFIAYQTVLNDYTFEDYDQVIGAFKKVWKNLRLL